MELTLTGGLKRSGQTTQATVRSAAAPAKGVSAQERARADRLERTGIAASKEGT